MSRSKFKGVSRELEEQEAISYKANYLLVMILDLRGVIFLRFLDESLRVTFNSSSSEEGEEILGEKNIEKTKIEIKDTAMVRLLNRFNFR